ncbi:MAG: PQQ-like beta-propeller repeat protein, partial [Phycisphaerales bacterium]|nr:PQQ-like beta-propeller repeat protein [Phycisphaerales bacterium]
MRLSTRLLGVSAILAMCVGVHAAEDWPQWRGPRLDGISKEVLPESLPEAGPKKVWSAVVGLGYASPIVVKGTLYVFGSEDDKTETLSAFNAADGKPLWKKSYESIGLSERGYRGPRATPAFEDGKVYTFGGGGQAVCWNAADGEIVWQTNVLQECNAKNINWGASSNPLLLGGRVYVQVGSGGPLAVGLNKASGKIEWKTEEVGLASYAQLMVIDFEGTKQMIICAGKDIRGVALDSGKPLWQLPFDTGRVAVNATPPLYRDGRILVSSGYGLGAMMIKLTSTGAEKEWESKTLASKHQGIILDGDYVYGNSAGKLVCLKWPNKEVIWTAADVRLGEGGTIVKAGDKILAASEGGTFYLVKTDGATCQVLSKVELFAAKQYWVTPLLY